MRRHLTLHAEGLTETTLSYGLTLPSLNIDCYEEHLPAGDVASHPPDGSTQAVACSLEAWEEIWSLLRALPTKADLIAMGARLQSAFTSEPLPPSVRGDPTTEPITMQVLDFPSRTFPCTSTTPVDVDPAHSACQHPLKATQTHMISATFAEGEDLTSMTPGAVSVGVCAGNGEEIPLSLSEMGSSSETGLCRAGRQGPASLDGTPRLQVSHPPKQHQWDTEMKFTIPSIPLPGLLDVSATPMENVPSWDLWCLMLRDMKIGAGFLPAQFAEMAERPPMFPAEQLTPSSLPQAQLISPPASPVGLPYSGPGPPYTLIPSLDTPEDVFSSWSRDLT